jgi:hypothetical protein
MTHTNTGISLSAGHTVVGISSQSAGYTEAETSSQIYGTSGSLRDCLDLLSFYKNWFLKKLGMGV